MEWVNMVNEANFNVLLIHRYEITLKQLIQKAKSKTYFLVWRVKKMIIIELPTNNIGAHSNVPQNAVLDWMRVGSRYWESRGVLIMYKEKLSVASTGYNAIKLKFTKLGLLTLER